MFKTILVANRGEIACRVMRTARRMGIRTVAVYSEADSGALHTMMADIAVPIGPAPARDSYLDVSRIIEAARLSGAEAVHPGYGFLSENAAFAEACAAAGLVFIGPPVRAIRAMGSKSAAKALMAEAGVPLVPGYHGQDQDPALLATQAADIGYPVLIKASAGGGGKGMRVVHGPEGFAEGLALAKGEAASAFGDDQVLIERYLTRPRHIEIQVFADQGGQVVSLFERDCSIQRRHQKVVEEAPAPGLTPGQRAEMGRAACAAAKAIGYVGAGTVEFIVDADTPEGSPPGTFFFMEMNTRLQVEHPVTEMVTGLDLVEWQLLIAAGAPLPTTEPPLSGHAIEVRIYAEDPARDFMPATGRIVHLRQPSQTPHVRIDSGVREGDAVTVHYDPMLAKLIVWDSTRDGAVRRLRLALSEYEVVGVQTNLELLRRIAGHAAFAGGQLDTGFIGRHEQALLSAPEPAPIVVMAAGAAHVARRRGDASTGDPFSPWSQRNGWRMNAAGYQEVVLRDGVVDRIVRVEWQANDRLTIRIDGVDGVSDGETITVGGLARRLQVVETDDRLTVILDGQNWLLTVVDRLAPPELVRAGSNRVVAPMPGRIVAVEVAPGQAVAQGDVLLILEAMKVQMRLSAPRDGRVAAVNVAAGDLVEDGAELIVMEAAITLKSPGQAGGEAPIGVEAAAR